MLIARRSWALWGVWDPGPPKKKQEPQENPVLPQPITSTRGRGGRLQAGVARQHPAVPQPWLDCQLIPCGRVETHGSPPPGLGFSKCEMRGLDEEISGICSLVPTLCCSV